MINRLIFFSMMAALILGSSPLAAQDIVEIPVAGMHDTLIERLVRENVIENHGTPHEIVIESKNWTVNPAEGIPEYKYLSVFARYTAASGICYLIEYSVECSFNISELKYSAPYCRGNGYGEGLEIKCDQ